MKLQVTIKDPDALYEAASSQVLVELLRAVDAGVIKKHEVDDLKDSRTDELMDKVKPWVECGEYFRIEFDTDAMTATVLKR